MTILIFNNSLRLEDNQNTPKEESSGYSERDEKEDWSDEEDSDDDEYYEEDYDWADETGGTIT